MLAILGSILDLRLNFLFLVKKKFTNNPPLIIWLESALLLDGQIHVITFHFLKKISSHCSSIRMSFKVEFSY
jgi:hypothetical protein